MMWAGMFVPLKYFGNISTEALQRYKKAVVYRYSRANPLPRLSGKGETATKIGVVNQDCLAAALYLCSVYDTAPAVLNMANEYNCGGGFDRMRGSQEEYLFRNTTLSASLWPHRRVDDNRWSTGSQLLGRDDAFYPLTEHGGIYSENVDVIGLLDEPIQKPFHIAVLTTAAQDLRPGRSYTTETGFNADLLEAKLRTCLHMAHANNHKALVLGAIGCGAFKNPPEQVAEVYKKLLTGDGEFAGVFDVVVFAIVLSAHNLSAFEAAFGESVRTAAEMLAPSAATR